MLDLDEWFQSFNAWLVGLIASQPKLKQYNLVEAWGRGCVAGIYCFPWWVGVRMEWIRVPILHSRVFHNNLTSSIPHLLNPLLLYDTTSSGLCLQHSRYLWGNSGYKLQWEGFFFKDKYEGSRNKIFVINWKTVAITFQDVFPSQCLDILE